MLLVRKADDRGRAEHGWLSSRHTFSFGEYRDPAHMGFGSLRVINEDRVAPGQGFGAHPHDNMEIISYVLEGHLEHRDSMGNGSVLTPGRFQRMSAGTGVAHSEFNPSESEPVHFYQFWLQPNVRGVEPSYEELDVPAADKRNQLRLVASPQGRDGSLTIHQDAEVYLGELAAGAKTEHALAASRHAWLQVIRGSVTVNGRSLAVGDAIAASDEPRLTIFADEDAEVMLFDLA
jgi:redox-sensitive bicupin YhaK (pirin superfamily)